MTEKQLNLMMILSLNIASFYSLQLHLPFGQIRHKYETKLSAFCNNYFEK